jgi:hypothetical protein
MELGRLASWVRFAVELATSAEGVARSDGARLRRDRNRRLGGTVAERLDRSLPVAGEPSENECPLGWGRLLRMRARMASRSNGRGRSVVVLAALGARREKRVISERTPPCGGT